MSSRSHCHSNNEVSGNKSAAHSNSYTRTSYCDSQCSEKGNKLRKLANRSPASRGYPVECIDFDEFSSQGDNKAVKYRTAHLQWLLDNDVFTLNGMNEWQPDLRRWTPSSSARYPLRMKIPKPPIDPETLPEDSQVHIYHSKKERLWVKQWLTGMLEANRYNVTTNRQQAPTNTSRMILVLTPELFDEPFCFQLLDAIEGKTVLGIKLRDCEVPEEISSECTSYMDLTTTDLSDLTFHVTFMFRIKKALKLPVSICSA